MKPALNLAGVFTCDKSDLIRTLCAFTIEGLINKGRAVLQCDSSWRFQLGLAKEIYSKNLDILIDFNTDGTAPDA